MGAQILRGGFQALPDRGDVADGDAGGVGVGAVHHELDGGGATGAEIPAEVLGDHEPDLGLPVIDGATEVAQALRPGGHHEGGAHEPAPEAAPAKGDHAG